MSPETGSRPVPPLSLYAHLPWCVQKCPYCDFNSHALGPNGPAEARYVAALIADLEFALPRIGARAITSIFIGGGTPSLFSGPALAGLLDAFRARLRLAPGIEITLEANPGSAEAARFKAYRRAGVNRLSIGVQSFNARCLGALGRSHGPDEARRAVEIARRAGFENLNIDLMFGLPNQTVADALADLAIAVALGPAHISWYQLTIEPHTVFYHKPPPLPADDRLWQMETEGRRYLASHGYRHYEISAFARAGRRCRHNLNYWQFGDYLGLGAGADSKLTAEDGRGVERQRRQRLPERYMALAGGRAAVSETRRLSRADRVFEFMLNALRLDEGVSGALFTERTGLPVAALGPAGERAVGRGLLSMDNGMIRPTATGRRYLNDLLEMFLD